LHFILLHSSFYCETTNETQIFAQIHFCAISYRLSSLLKFPVAILSVFANIYAPRASLVRRWSNKRNFIFTLLRSLSSLLRQVSVSVHGRAKKKRLLRSLSIDILRENGQTRCATLVGGNLYVSARHEIGKWNSHRPLILSCNVERRMTFGHARVSYVIF